MKRNKTKQNHKNLCIFKLGSNQNCANKMEIIAPWLRVLDVLQRAQISVEISVTTCIVDRKGIKIAL